MLRVLFPIYLLVAPLILLASQEPPDKWRRVYTGDDSVIEISVSNVTFSAYNVSVKVNFRALNTARVRFRTTFSKLQTLDDTPTLKYKSRVDTYEFHCQEESRVIRNEQPDLIHLTPLEYRLYESKLLGLKGEIIKSYDHPSDWKPNKNASLMDKLNRAACALIEEKINTP